MDAVRIARVAVVYDRQKRIFPTYYAPIKQEERSMRIVVRGMAVVGVVVSLVMLSSPVSASLLDYSGGAFDDGSKVWSGSTSFDDDAPPVPNNSLESVLKFKYLPFRVVLA